LNSSDTLRASVNLQSVFLLSKGQIERPAKLIPGLPIGPRSIGFLVRLLKGPAVDERQMFHRGLCPAVDLGFPQMLEFMALLAKARKSSEPLHARLRPCRWVEDVLPVFMAMSTAATANLTATSEVVPELAD
jgi:hypothetical protein